MPFPRCDGPTLRDMVQDWDALDPGDLIVVSVPGLPPRLGSFEDCTYDRTIVWVNDFGAGRRMFFQADSVDLYRILGAPPTPS